MSRRQLHEEGWACLVRCFTAARSCGMEARGQAQHRTQVKPRKADLIWVSELGIATPDVQSWQVGTGYWGRRRRKAIHPYPGRSARTRKDRDPANCHSRLPTARKRTRTWTLRTYPHGAGTCCIKRGQGRRPVSAPQQTEEAVGCCTCYATTEHPASTGRVSKKWSPTLRSFFLECVGGCFRVTLVPVTFDGFGFPNLEEAAEVLGSRMSWIVG